jgi:heme A synthase
MKLASRVFLIAGIYGLIVLVPQYFTEARTGRDYPPAITHPEFYYGFLGVAISWQIAFLVISKDPLRYRAMMIVSILEKITFGVAVVVLFLQQRTSSMTLGFAIIDLIFAALFTLAYLRSAPDEVARRVAS